MAKRDVDACIEAIASQVHSPLGTQAEREAVYNRLSQRLDRTEVRLKPRRSALSLFIHRYGVAASFLIVVTLSVACVYTFRPEWFRPAETTAVVVPAEGSKPKSDLVFQAATMDSIAAQLTATYGKPIKVVTPELKTYRVTATFSADESITDVLSVLCTVAKCQWRKTEEGYEVF